MRHAISRLLCKSFLHDAALSFARLFARFSFSFVDRYELLAIGEKH